MTTTLSSKEDWTFLDYSTQKFTHGFHLYPARMHPEIAKRLIERYAVDAKKVVFDPFMGSGGVLVESLIHGNNSVGIDVNPFAVLLSRVKTTPVDPKLLQSYFDDILSRAVSDYKTKKFHEDVAPQSKSLNLKFWYGLDVIRKLQILKYHIFNLDSDDSVKDFFKICFSLTSRKTSYQRNSIYKIYRLSKEDTKTFRPDAFEVFGDICKKNISKMAEFDSVVKPKVKTYPFLGDSRNILESFSKVPKGVLDDGKAHLVVTSPPYGDHRTTVAYGQFSKHPGLWLELDEDKLLNVDTTGLGGAKKTSFSDLDSSLLDITMKKVQKNDEALSKKDKKPYRTADVFAFFFDLDQCLKEISKFLKQGESHCCFVVANRTVRRVVIPTDKIIVELGKKYGFKHKETIYRTIANKAMSQKNAPENIVDYVGETMTRESIVIWEF